MIMFFIFSFTSLEYKQYIVCYIYRYVTRINKEFSPVSSVIYKDVEGNTFYSASYSK